MADNRKIQSVAVVQPKQFGETGSVLVTCDQDSGGAKFKLFSFFADEINFTSGEFLGLTIDQALELRHKKDVAYLQSQS